MLGLHPGAGHMTSEQPQASDTAPYRNPRASRAVQAVLAEQPAQAAQAAAQAAAAEDSLLHTVLNNMTQGVLMFDSDTRLVFCNRRYIEMYGLSPDAGRPGRHLRELLKLRIAAGTFVGNPDDYITRLRETIAKGRMFGDVVTGSDGRAFSIVNKPLAGGGWLATHEDITERRRARGQIGPHAAPH